MTFLNEYQYIYKSSPCYKATLSVMKSWPHKGGGASLEEGQFNGILLSQRI